MGIYIGQQRLSYLWEKIKTLVSAKQDVLSFDNTPTSGSTNPVTSGGIHSYYNNKEKVIAAALNDLEARKLDISDIVTDEVPTENSTNFVTSGGLYNVITENEEIVASAINDLNDKKADISSLSPVATSGSYNDLTDKPEISSSVTEQTVSGWGFTKNSGTVNSITINATSPITIDNSAAITTSGTRTISHGNSGVSAGTYKSVTVDAKGHVTGGTNPTTLSGYGITDAINTSSTAQTKAGNLTAAKFVTNGGSASQFVKGDGSLDSNTYMSQKLLESRGENLIYNGNGFMRDNTNFPSFVFDQTECNGSIGSFKKTGSVQAMCTYSIPVSPSLTYMFRIDGKQSEQTKLFYAMLRCIDVDGYEILPENYYWKEAEKTELTQDLVAGDTIIHLANISDEWLKTTGGTGSTIINFWNYTNSKGYTFPPYTYTRNSLNYGSYDAIDRATNTITLSVPYSGKTIPVGTKVSRKRYGGTYLYLWNGKFNSDWTTKTSILGDINTSGWEDIQNGKHVFRPGTSFVKLGFLVNWSGANTQTTWITNISFSANDAGMSLPLIGGTLTGSIEATSFKKTGGTSSQFLKADGSVDSNTYLTSYTETDPTVPAWAKASTKPTYTASEVGALPSSTVIPDAPGTLNTTATTAQNTSSSETLSGNITLHKVAKTGTYNDLIGKPTIPSEVTESTVSGWGFTKNTGTYSKPSGGIPATDLATTVQTSLGKADTALQSYTETDPVFSASAAAGISSTDISNWNSKTSNVGTITGITMNGASKGTSGVVDLGTVITAHQSLSGKQDVINDLATIRSNASSGAAAATTIAGYGDIVTHNASEFQTKITVSSSNPSGGNNGDIWIVI